MDNQREWQVLFNKIIDIVGSNSGNVFGEKQMNMVETRVRKRMMDLKINDPTDYLCYIQDHYGDEVENLVSLLTTHHTFFFREFFHFEYLRKVLPELAARARQRGDKKIRVWSAACSRGHEVYSLAMYLAQHAPALGGIDFEIWGSDIDATSVQHAQNGVYHQSDVAEIPANFLHQAWLRGSGEISQYFCIKKELRSKCQFQKMNLLELPEVWNPAYFDVIFCRNVLIYFDEVKVKKIIHDLQKKLGEGGYLMVGITESVMLIQSGMKAMGEGVYQKLALNAPTVTPSPSPTLTGQTPRRVVLVDDSPNILKLLQNVFTKESGYEVVGTAENGKVAAEVIARTRPDVVTLDIHMPEMTGIEYLERYYNAHHPPVIMVTSVSRYDDDLAAKAMKLGASDYIEKPSLKNFLQYKNELLTKVRALATHPNASRAPVENSFFQSYKTDSNANANANMNAKRCVNVVTSAMSSEKDLVAYLKEGALATMPVMVVVDIADHLFEMYLSRLENLVGRKPKVWSSALMAAQWESGQIYLASMKQLGQILPGLAQERVVFTLLNLVKQSDLKLLVALANLNSSTAYLFTEAYAQEEMISRSFRHEIVPLTSFHYVVRKFARQLIDS